MKSRKDFKKKNANYRRNQEEGTRIRAIKKHPKKINKNNYYSMIEDEEDLINVNLYYDDEDFG